MKNRVVFRLRGRMLEKFVVRAVQEGVFFESVERISEQEMRLAATEKQAKNVALLAEEYQMDLTVLREEGVPFWKKRFRERGSLVMGLMMGMLLIVAFTSRIWKIEAISLDGTAGSELLEDIEQYAWDKGARPGVDRTSVDRDALAIDVHTMWPELTHVSVRLSGVRLQVEVAMEEAVPELYDVDAERDLVADRDAVVLYVEPLAGQAAVKAGDTVRRGQVLIRGEERTGDDQTRGIRALGNVLARVWFTDVCELPIEETVSERTGRSNTSSSFRLGEWEWEIVPAEDYIHQETQEELLPIGGLYFPLKMVRTIRWETQKKTVFQDMAALLLEGERQALERARSQLPNGAEETAYWTENETVDGALVVRATIEAQMNIASERSALINE